MPFNSDTLHHLEISQDQYNPGNPWPDDSWLDELVTLDDINPVDPSYLGPDFDLLWSQINGDGLYSVSGSSEPPLSPSTSLVPPSESSLQSRKPSDIYEIGYQDTSGDWRCNYFGCLSNQIFLRACDLRKHYRSHQKTFFCKEQDCEWSKIGFSSRKDCQRHMRSHRPMIKCSAAETLGCERKDHHRKVHKSSQNNASPHLCRRNIRKKDDVSKPSEHDAA
ncbi:hypothetical protein N7447_003877 [Penicillium robsamsonii]|uniref:uncharacterized protein n=1 Tax=Penicillium robsamsonii TaxID=1792511 RepID=UPI002547C2B3|nr:uncharacterized protein N7447_003877 [Penicillium robsamsonii]KAJ5827114.1 hypothetical protein N7447_003877 [Penicillium robsamsonii]